jgi:hypothetical protein
MHTHIYIYIYISPSGHPHVYIQKIHLPAGQCHTLVQKSAHQPINNHKVHIICQGASIAPPPTPPLGGGGGTPAGPSYPGDRHPLVIAASTAARSTIPCHGGGTPIHCSRNPSYWMRIHMPSGTSYNTVSKRRRISSKSTPAAVGGACDGPTPGLSNRRLLSALSGFAGRPAASSRRCLSPHGSLSGSR